MSILVTGAAGFVGQALASALVQNAHLKQLMLTDVVEPDLPQTKSTSGPQVRCVKADLTDKAACEQLFTPELSTVYLLHGLMSGATEANLDLGLKVNVDSTRQIIDILRAVKPGIRIVYTSSCAVYDSGSQPISEKTLPSPGSSYGSQKLMCEILLNDLSRRELIDAIIVHLPTIIVRPGAPSGAASSFCSGIIREPLSGKKAQLPVSRDLDIWVCSTRTVVKNLVLAGDIPREKLGRGSRLVNLPGITVTVEQMLRALKEVIGDEALSLVEEKRDPAVEKIVYDWAYQFDVSRALEMGFVKDGPLERTIKEYIEDYAEQCK